jgi:hypothetical protein
MDQFSYYMIRIRHTAAEPQTESLAGIVERLGAGEKQKFADGAELLRLLAGWSEGLSNMRPLGGGGKAQNRCQTHMRDRLMIRPTFTAILGTLTAVTVTACSETPLPTEVRAPVPVTGAPSLSTVGTAPAIGGNAVAWQDFTYGTTANAPEIAVHELGTTNKGGTSGVTKGRPISQYFIK